MAGVTACRRCSVAVTDWRWPVIAGVIGLFLSMLLVAGLLALVVALQIRAPRARLRSSREIREKPSFPA